MKTAYLFFFLATLGAFAAQTEVVTLDLARPKQPFAITFTDSTATTVEARLRYSGADFDPTGWTGLLWFGVAGGGGITLTNVAASAGVMTWDVTESHVPTNGRYSVQIFGSQTNRLEEWGRGALTVNLSPSKGSLPADWQSPSSTLRAAINAATNALSVSVAANLASATGVLAIASEVATTNEAAIRAAADTALLTSNDLARVAITDVSTALLSSNTLARAAITNEATIRAAADVALLASNEQVRVANTNLAWIHDYDFATLKSGLNLSLANVTNEAAIRAAADTALLASNTLARAAITNEATIRASIDTAISNQVVALPRVPTNAVTGWLLYDSGSNKWLRVSVSNYSYYISEVL